MKKNEVLDFYLHEVNESFVLNIKFWHSGETWDAAPIDWVIFELLQKAGHIDSYEHGGYDDKGKFVYIENDRYYVGDYLKENRRKIADIIIDPIMKTEEKEGINLNKL